MATICGNVGLLESSRRVLSLGAPRLDGTQLRDFSGRGRGIGRNVGLLRRWRRNADECKLSVAILGKRFRGHITALTGRVFPAVSAYNRCLLTRCSAPHHARDNFVDFFRVTSRR